jgi:hypothetical protein
VKTGRTPVGPATARSPTGRFMSSASLPDYDYGLFLSGQGTGLRAPFFCLDRRTVYVPENSTRAVESPKDGGEKAVWV